MGIGSSLMESKNVKTRKKKLLVTSTSSSVCPLNKTKDILRFRSPFLLFLLLVILQKISEAKAQASFESKRIFDF